jgi:hypothetical protein
MKSWPGFKMLYMVSMNATMLFAQSMKKQVEMQSHSSFSVYTYMTNNSADKSNSLQKIHYFPMSYDLDNKISYSFYYWVMYPSFAWQATFAK